MQRGHHAGVGCRDFDDGLGGLDSQHGLIRLDSIAHLDVPADNFRFGQALTEVGEMEGSHCGSARSVAQCLAHGVHDARDTRNVLVFELE